MSLWKSIEDTLRDMERVNAHAAKLGRDMVIAEAAYYGAKSRAAFGLKEQGYAVTFIEMAVKGVPEVAEAMMEYHMAQIEYDNARECVNVMKKKFQALNDQLQREWTQSGMRG